jgi:NAD(P)-dependent dehydrogenase (short-subunit alcohol dehydrogenase family)
LSTQGRTRCTDEHGKKREDAAQRSSVQRLEGKGCSCDRRREWLGLRDRKCFCLELRTRELGRNVEGIAFDLNAIDRIPELVTAITKSTGAIDVLVNNAGVNLKKDSLHVTDEEYQTIVHTNQTAVFALTREVLKSMAARSTGNIIMISSMASQYGIPKVIGYTASKSAVEGMTRALAVECAQYGIRVNCVAPGFIKTDMSWKALNTDPERKRRVLTRTPMARLGEPADVAHAALFLASEQSKFVTGVVLPVDGGNSIGF